MIKSILRAKKHAAAVVDVLGDDLEKTLGAGVDGQTAGILEEHGHRRALVQDSQLALGTLLVSGVGKDTAIQQGAVGVSDHAANVPGAVGLLALARVLERVEVLVDPVVPVHAITLIDRVDGAFGGELHVGVGQDELAQGVFQGEAVDSAVAHGDDELRGCAIHGETGGDHLGTGAQDVIGRDLLVGADQLVGKLEDAEDGANRDASVKIGRAVDGITDDGVSGVGVLIKYDRLFLLLGDEYAALAGASHGGNKDVISDYIQLLLVIAGCV